jgi:HD-GYP domain-containing protein (c-di-GMP phosphodiesterase class II)
MNPQKKAILLLVGGLALCLAAGLCIHDRFVQAAAKWHQQASGADSNTGSTSGLRLDARPGSTLELFAVKSLSFFWICGLQSALVWLVYSRMQGEHARRQSQSQEETLLRAQELVRVQEAVILGLAKLAESRDSDTGLHLDRIALYSSKLAAALKRDPRYARQVSSTFLRTIGTSSALHDIGKVGISDSILLKPGPLTPEERAKMQRHTTIAGECIRQIQRRSGASDFLDMAYEIAMFHHERWDGKGYPKHLRGEEIPLAARIVAIADVYDALSMERCYKPPYPHEQCVEMIRREAGQQFDPNLVEVFLSMESQFREIARRLRERSAPAEECATPSQSNIESANVQSPPVEAVKARGRDAAGVPDTVGNNPS